MTPAPSHDKAHAASTSLAAVSALTGVACLFWAVERLKWTPATFLDQLREIRSSSARRSEVARQAYWHSNGFAKFKILDVGDYCVRLHVWPPGENRKGEVDPHNHRWDFASWVAVGVGMQELRFERTSRTDVGRAYTRCAYGRENGVGYLRPVDTAWLQQSDTLNRVRGHVYRCPPDVLHTVAPLGTGLVATVVLQGPEVKESAEVYCSTERDDTVGQPTISPRELASLVDEVEDAMNQTTLTASA